MRRNSRELALQILFQSEFAPTISTREYSEVMQGDFLSSLDPESVQFAQALIKGVQDKKADIDAKIQQASQHWKMERMAGVDRNILRLAVYEMAFASEALKPAIAINEAVELAKKFGTTDSASFVNGILDQIGKRL